MRYLAKNLKGEDRIYQFQTRQERTKAVNESLNKGFKAVIYKLRKRKNKV